VIISRTHETNAGKSGHSSLARDSASARCFSKIALAFSTRIRAFIRRTDSKLCQIWLASVREPQLAEHTPVNSPIQLIIFIGITTDRDDGAVVVSISPPLLYQEAWFSISGFGSRPATRLRLFLRAIGKNVQLEVHAQVLRNFQKGLFGSNSGMNLNSESSMSEHCQDLVQCLGLRGK